MLGDESVRKTSVATALVPGGNYGTSAVLMTGARGAFCVGNRMSVLFGLLVAGMCLHKLQRRSPAPSRSISLPLPASSGHARAGGDDARDNTGATALGPASRRRRLVAGDRARPLPRMPTGKCGGPVRSRPGRLAGPQAGRPAALASRRWSRLTNSERFGDSVLTAATGRRAVEHPPQSGFRWRRGFALSVVDYTGHLPTPRHWGTKV